MSCLTPGFAIALHAHGQLRSRHAAKAHEDRQAHPPDVRERLGGRGGHADRRMGLLIRARGHRGVLEAIEFPLVAEGLALPRREDDLERLEKARLTLLVRNAERVVRPRAAAPSDPEVE